MMRIELLFAPLLLGLAASAAAQDPVLDAPDAATAHALAQAALVRSGGEAVWENVTTTTTPELRHRQSGGICRFWAGSLYPWADTDSYGIAIPLGSEVACSTWIRPQGRQWSFETYIEAASQSLDGERYRGFDGALTPAFVTPEYRGRRSMYWAAFRRDPIEHEPVRMLRGPDGEDLPVYGVRALMADNVSAQRILTVLVNGWVVTQQLYAPADEERAAEAMALAQLQRLVSGMTRPHPEAAAVHARVEALRRAEAAPPPGLDDPIGARIAVAFAAACVEPAAEGRAFESAIAAQPGWTAVAAPPGLPNIRRDPAPRVWRLPGEGGEVYVHLDAGMTGDCAVSAYAVDGARARRVLTHKLTQGPGARFALGFRTELDPGIESQGLDGRGWAVEASLITNANDDAGRPAVFLGLRPPRRR